MQSIGKQQVIVAAVAAAFLSAPTTLLAQSSVTISGVLRASFDNIKIDGRAGRSNETKVNDESSNITFSVTEDLGGGLQAIGRIEMRPSLDSGALTAAGTTYVGLRSKSWGQLTFGRHNLHYINTESDLYGRGGSLRGDSTAILSYVNGGATPIANATRTPNTIHWLSPNWSGFTAIVAYSTTAGGAAGPVEADIGSPVRRGQTWHFNPNYKAANWQIGYSYINAKVDGAFAGFNPSLFNSSAGLDQRGNRLYGSYNWGGFKAGLVWDKSRLRTVTAAATTEVSDRTAWSIPLSYSTGSHSFHAHFDKARHDKAAGFSGLDTKANMFALAYVYDLSKRTAVGLTYAKINNGAAAFYSLYTPTSGTQSPTGVGSTGVGVNAGEDPRLFAATVRHSF